MKLGDKGDLVKDIQTKLNKLGYKVLINGIFDETTQHQVCLLQKANNLSTSGIIDSNTLATINKKIATLPKHKPVVAHKKLVEMNEKIFANIHPEVVKLGKQLRQTVKDKYNLDIIFTYGFRSIAQQNNLYASGRTKKGNIVTNAKGGFSFHNYGLALDFAILKNGKVDWNDMASYKKVGQEAVKLGFEWGGNFDSIKDYPHIQKTFGLSIKELLAGKRPK